MFLFLLSLNFQAITYRSRFNLRALVKLASIVLNATRHAGVLNRTSSLHPVRYRTRLPNCVFESTPVPGLIGLTLRGNGFKLTYMRHRSRVEQAFNIGRAAQSEPQVCEAESGFGAGSIEQCAIHDMRTRLVLFSILTG
jgi:hypothetical protein